MNSIFNDIKNAFNRHDNSLNQLILINILVFVALILLRTILWLAQTDYFGTIMSWLSLPSDPVDLLWHPWTIFTYFFTHRDWLHIIFNMLNLYWFGMLIREYLGSKKLVSLYILGGLSGAVLYLLFYNFVPFFIQRGSAEMIGASASVLAIIVAAATLLPDYTFNLLLLGPVKIKWIAWFLVLLSVSGAVGDNAGGNVAHLGGALLGYIFIRQLKNGSDMGRFIHSTWAYISGLFSRRPRMKVSYKNPATATYAASSASGKPSQNEIDFILDKISKSGYESLSKEEKQKLFRASQKE
ncbi:rhomboid family intramembrane serine protease [Adhaeribacter aerolatus]|uniref:Rhomboid family intramembrane serine protease n=1 Tax=Adhaeribacter aerolatus TaxID=670289 RepID=A0A512B451_9BACT|nr:rhomboid family intramembrane serine protease [Adhaeribacter aerolatus]GEO06738.1 rhomboid family intramembrane serine protease [Adhaeribacter aerolatus]